MINHIVLFKLKDSADDAVISDLMAGFEALPAVIPEIVAIDVARDIVGRPVSCTFGLNSRFADRETLATYQAHPVHIAAFERTKVHLDSMLVLDYESPDA
jgi:hypothetical protein